MNMDLRILMRRSWFVAVLALVLAVTSACTNKKVTNPLANLGSKQPDKVLFDRAMDALKHNKFDVARMVLQTLINAYPDSEYIARAKLAVGDSWYAEGGSTALQQAEIEYKDFITYFHNMQEAAEAQLKVATIHYHQMKKADRDFTHATRAEEEYRNLITQFPESKLVGEAKQRLMEVQEVLAQREFNIGRFYYLRQAYPASIARLQTLVDRYPLYSRADEALYLIGQSNEQQIARIRKVPTCGKVRTMGCVTEADKARSIDRLAKEAADVYGKIIRRYPAMDCVWDAKTRLEALNQPVPKPTVAAMELNKKEVASRHTQSMLSSVIGGFTKHPDTERAAKVGEPTMSDGRTILATDVVKSTLGEPSSGGDTKLTSEVVNVTPAPNREPQRSDTALPAGDPLADSATEQQPGQAADQQPGPGELTPNVADPINIASNDPYALPPIQYNELANANGSATASASNNPNDLVDISSSKKKKKKGLGKLNLF